MSLAVTVTSQKSERMTRNMGVLAGKMAFNDTYTTGGFDAAGISKYFKSSRLFSVQCEQEAGYAFMYDDTNDKIKVYAVGALTGIAAEAAHTHVMPGFDNYGPADITGITKGTPALVHNADPTGNLAALPLYGLEGYGASGRNILSLQSTTNANTSIMGSLDDITGIFPGACTPRFYVHDSDAPAGVKIYVEDATPWKLEFVSPTGEDAYIICPFEAVANTPPGYAYAIKVTHAADAATGVELEFDDNGSADAQLVFVDGSTTSRVINPADIEVLAPSYMAIAQAGGTSSAGSSHTHTASGDVGEVDNGADLSTALAAVNFIAVGLV